MIGVIRAVDFEWQSFYSPGKVRDYRLKHLPTNLQWDLQSDVNVSTLDKERYLFGQATHDLIALGWQPDEDWKERMTYLLARSGGVP
jgi:hypothetical protein